MSRKYTIFVNHPSYCLTDCEPKGDGLLAFQYIDRLAQRGHELYVAAPIVKLREPLRHNVHLFVVNTVTKPSWEFPSGPNRIEFALRVRHLFKQLQRNISFDVIHQLNPVTTGVNLFFPAKNIPFVMGPLPPSWDSKSASRLGPFATCHSIFRCMIRCEMFRRASRILIPVPSGRDVVPNFHFLRSRIKLLHYGVDTKQFAPRDNSLNDTKFGLHVLFLANMYKVKGIYDLLRAFEIIIKSVPQAHLTIAGDGPEWESVKRTVGAMPVSNRITMLGSISRDKLADLFHSCTVYCLPSHGEPFGMTALEAMSCGKPVVVTAAGGLDYLVDEQGGVKVPVGDAKKLAEALIQLLTDPQLCKQMGKHNREVAVFEYDWDRVISNLEEIYDEAIHDTN